MSWKQRNADKNFDNHSEVIRMADEIDFLTVLDGLHNLGMADVTQLASYLECNEHELEPLLEEMLRLELVDRSTEGVAYSMTEVGRKRLDRGIGRLKTWGFVKSRWIDPATGRPVEDWRQEPAERSPNHPDSG